jgi:hypothetical protein
MFEIKGFYVVRKDLSKRRGSEGAAGYKTG